MAYTSKSKDKIICEHKHFSISFNPIPKQTTLQMDHRVHLCYLLTELIQKRQEIKILTWRHCAYIPDPKPFFLPAKGINKWQIRATGRTEENSLGRRESVISNVVQSSWKEYYNRKPDKFSMMDILWGCVYAWDDQSGLLPPLSFYSVYYGFPIKANLLSTFNFFFF